MDHLSRCLLGPVAHPLGDYQLFIFDADGTLRETFVDGAVQPRPPNRPGEWRLLPNVQTTLAHYNWQTVGSSIASNQGGVGLEYMTESMARFLLMETLAEATGETMIAPKQILMCPHAPSDGCACRKPKPALLSAATTYWVTQGIVQDKAQVLYIGDQPSDREAAEAFSCDFCYAADFFGWGLP